MILLASKQMATTPASPSAPSNGSFESLGQKPPRPLEALRKLPNDLTESSPGYEIFKNIQKNMASSEWNQLLFMKSNTHICPSLESVTKKTSSISKFQKNWRSPWYPLPNTPFPTILWPVFFQRLVEMRVSMAMEDHTTPSAAKKATNLVLRASKLGWKTWKRRRKQRNCQCDCKCAYSNDLNFSLKRIQPICSTMIYIFWRLQKFM